jgi:hypothetical protein
MTIDENERIIGAWAESPSGPGWSNHLVWVCVESSLGSLRVDSFQRGEMTAEMVAIFGICVAASDALIAAARNGAGKGRR